MIIQQGTRLAFRKGFSDGFTEIIVDSISSDTLFYQGGMISANRIIGFRLQEGGKFYDIDVSACAFVVPPSDALGSEHLMKMFRTWIGTHCEIDGSYDELKWQLYHSKITAGYDSLHHNFLKFNMLRVLYLQFTAVYERKLTKNLSIEVEGGYQVRLEIGHQPFLYYNDNPLYPFSGPLITLGMKFYGLSGLMRYLYLEPQVLYKYVYFKQEWFEDPHENGSIFQDQYRNVAAGSINIGFQKISTGMVVDMAFGVGMKYTHIHSLCYMYKEPQSGTNYYNSDQTPVTQDENRWYPFLNLAVKLGFGF